MDSSSWLPSPVVVVLQLGGLVVVVVVVSRGVVTSGSGLLSESGWEVGKSCRLGVPCVDRRGRESGSGEGQSCTAGLQVVLVV